MHSKDPDANGALKLVAAAAAFVVAAFIVLVVAGAKGADAADKGGPSFLPVPGAEIVAPSPWTGCYVAANLGYATQSTEVAFISFDAKDVTYGIGAGCDAKLGSTNLVLGILADIDWTKADSAIASLNYSWFAGGRFGVLVSPTTLLYGLAGYSSLDGSVPAGFSNFEGLTVGAGIEHMFGKNWSVKAEYRYIDLGSDPGIGPFTAENSQQAARLGIAYHF